MPIDLSCNNGDSIEFEEFVELLFDNKINPRDQESLATAAPLLKRLANNRTFLAQTICKELSDHENMQASNNYSAQAYLLQEFDRPGQPFFLRACFWPSEQDQTLKISGADTFSYHLPHDHNYNFLTVGYHGPGYRSDYYAYDHNHHDGVPGEKIPLTFVERSSLSPGRILLYRAFTDVHSQLPPESFSISLNIMENSVVAAMTDQYVFDIEGGRLQSLVNRTPAVSLFNAAAALGEEAHRDLLRHIARRHAINRVRLAALDALAHTAADHHAAIQEWAVVTHTDSSFIRSWRARRTAELERSAKTAQTALP